MKVFYVDEPAWYSRLTFTFRHSWRREVATLLGVLAFGLAVGAFIGRFAL